MIIKALQFEALLDAMRFREELDIRRRHKRRLMNAKRKVVTWLLRNQSADIAQWSSCVPSLNKNSCRE